MVLTCREVYQKAHERRAKHPLKSGRYKLEETLLALRRLEITLALKGRSPDSCNGLERGLPQPVCIPNEFRSWGPVAEVHNILDRIEPEATKFLATAEMIRRDIQGRPITKRQVDALYRLVEDMLRLFTAVHFSTN